MRPRSDSQPREAALPVTVAIVGMGAMGRGLLHQIAHTPGVVCRAIADLRLDRALACAEASGEPYRLVASFGELCETVRRGELAVCAEGDWLARCDGVELLLEASSSIREGGRFALTALEHHKHLVLMNSEVDLAFGPYLLPVAEANGVIYTSCDGDQHGVLKRLADEVRLWGFELVMAGNIKGFLDRYADPTRIIPEADKRRLDYRMCTAYTDGTKLAIEMALVANGLGLCSATPGMYGPRAADVHEVFELFDLAALHREHGGVVDYVLGAEPGGGVYLVGWCNEPYQRQMMAYYKMGDGPYYLFYRPYHLCHVEAMRCLIEAAVDRRPLLQPVHGFRTNVVAYAKRDLRAGERLDGVGGYTCYGLLENCSADNPDPGLPICLSDGLPVRHAVQRDERIRWADVQLEAPTGDDVLFAQACEMGSRQPA